MKLAALALLSLVTTSEAFAVCPGPYTHHQWSADLDAISDSLSKGDPAKASTGIRTVYELMPCLDTVARRGELGRYARLRSITSFFDQEEDATLRWATLQRLAAPGLKWSGLTPPPAWQSTIEEMDAPIRGGDSSEFLANPDGGWVFIDGEYARTARIQAEVPHLVQITDKRGSVTLGWWQDGARFSSELLTTEPTEPPTWFYEWSWSTVSDVAADPWAFGPDASTPVAPHGPAKLPAIPPEKFVLPAELNTETTKFPERRAMNVEQFERKAHTTGVLAAMMVRDPEPTVQKRAWEAIRLRWEHGHGDDGMAETAARWILADGPGILVDDALDAIGKFSDDPHYLMKLLEDPRANIRRGALQAVGPFAARHPECRELLWHKLGELRLAEKNGKTIAEMDALLGQL